ncbi:preprotein translocase subunit SecD [Methanococcoides alaskense]|uniref:Protein-export membrane protein SecD n=1 Tax=Methanococcoides alaskense TaxID=325778 RepID=A0AA90Z7C8_9EURY|nr:preprotein translocase subunit SecD [Methanococcoides alaskense]MDA0524679.1 preprotein translocase subunit SecD [Methanococcoides alaskense]MDR6222394.1 preprotein translocase subunit SecD [Methanococcoides alaskense]
MREEEVPKGLKNDIRVWLLIAAVVLSVVMIGPGYSAEEGLNTDLNYGLDLEGGSWIQIKLQGAVTQLDADISMLVTEIVESAIDAPIEIISVTGDEGEGYSNDGNTVTFTTSTYVSGLQMDLLGLGASDISFSDDTSSIVLSTNKQTLIMQYLSKALNTEVVPLFVGDGVEYEIRTAVSLEELQTLMVPVGGNVLTGSGGDVIFREGVRTETRDMTRDILSEKLNSLGLKDIPVRTVGEEYILIDFAGTDLTTAKEIVEKPGKFEIRMQTTGNESVHVLYGDSIEKVGIVTQMDGHWNTPFTLDEDGAFALQKIAIETGAIADPNSHLLYMYLDDNEVYGAPLSYSAASALDEHPIYSWQASTGADEDGKTQADQLQIHLRAGALPVNVVLMGSGQVDAALGDQFKRQVVLAGLFALLAVAVVVFRRYHQKEILLPMVGTSLCEVIIILGFAGAVNWQLDLPAIAGIIAAIGTGIDHLVIITDEVLYEGKLPSTKVYMERISKAFAIIFAAAATTTIAMSPLVVMGFGALRGFAITTIIGVLIGVLIARPVYGKVIKVVLDKAE